MTYLYRGRTYLGLKQAAAELQMSTEDLLQQGKLGLVKLSIEIPEGHTAWQMTVKVSDDPLASIDDPIPFGHYSTNILPHLFPRRSATCELLNISPTDCENILLGNAKQILFESIYIKTHGLALGQSLLFIENNDETSFPNHLQWPALYKPEPDNDFNYSEDKIKSISEGYHLIATDDFARRFAVFKNEFAMPEKGTSLNQAAALRMKEENIFIADSELQRLSSVKEEQEWDITEDEEKSATHPKGFTVGKWTSDTLELLNTYSCRIHPHDKKHSTCTDENQSITKSISEKLAEIKTGSGTNLVNYFKKLASCDENFYCKTILSKVSGHLKEARTPVPKDTPTILFLMNMKAEEYFNESQDRNNKTYTSNAAIIADLISFGFSKNLSKTAATIITLSKHSERQHTKNTT